MALKFSVAREVTSDEQRAKNLWRVLWTQKGTQIRTQCQERKLNAPQPHHTTRPKSCQTVARYAEQCHRIVSCYTGLCVRVEQFHNVRIEFPYDTLNVTAVLSTGFYCTVQY